MDRRTNAMMIAVVLASGLGSPVAHGQKVYWTSYFDALDVKRADFDGGNTQGLVANDLLSKPTGIAVDPTGSKIYWADNYNGLIQRADFDGQNIEDVTAPGSGHPMAIALDPDNGKLYWTDDELSQEDLATIRRANLDGTNVEILFTSEQPSSLWGIALDSVAAKIYWTDCTADSIRRANLDGSGMEEVIAVGLDCPTAFALDSAGGKMYWADGDWIRRANLDGASVEDLVYAHQNPRTIAINPDVGKMYWTEGNTAGRIRQANLDGSDPEILINLWWNAPGETSFPWGVALDLVNGRIYWADMGDWSGIPNFFNGIRRANLDGSGVEDVVVGGRRYSGDIALDLDAAKMYWTKETFYYIDDQPSHEHTIQRSNLDGSEVEIVADGEQLYTCIALHPAAGKLYWSTHSAPPSEWQLQCANLDGTDVETLVAFDDEHRPTRLALDPYAGKMYWTARDGDFIHRANLDGSGVEEVLSGLTNPYGLALDHERGKMYWMVEGWGDGKIQRASLDGSGIEDLVTGLWLLPYLSAGIALDIDGGHMFWNQALILYQADLDGSNIQLLMQDIFMVDMALDLRVAGDCDANSTVDLADFGSFVECITGPGESRPPDCQCADLDYNRSVDLADFGAFQRALSN